MEEQQRTQRIALQSVRTIRTSGVPANANFENYYYPINVNQIRELEESIHTRLEMLNLSKKSEDAAKVVFNELLWQWFYEAQENCTTSYQGCIAPVVTKKTAEMSDDREYPSNRWGWKSEEEYLEATETVEDSSLKQ